MLQVLKPLSKKILNNKNYRHLKRVFKFPKSADPNKAANYLFALMKAKNVRFKDFITNNGFAPISDGSSIAQEDDDDIADMTMRPGGYENNYSDIQQDKAEARLIDTTVGYIFYDAGEGEARKLEIRDVANVFNDFVEYINTPRSKQKADFPK